jgi:microcystin degradation protein MlrC
MPAVIVGSIAHELHSFVPGTTGWDEVHRQGFAEGPAVFDDIDGTSLAGALLVTEARGIEIVPTLMAFAGAGPVIDEVVYAELRQRLLGRIEAALGDFEGIYLPLHGAMATTERDDPEGELIEAIRALVGVDIPIVVSLDLHAHVTDRMVAHADAIIGYRTCPHIDIFETGTRSMELLADAVEGRCAPVLAQRKIPMIASAEAHDTTFGPLAPFQQRARELEAQDGVLAVSIFATQPWMDVPELGWSVTVVTDGDLALAQRTADVLAEELWSARRDFDVVKTPIDEALALAHEHRRAGRSGPVVVADGSDSPSAGSLGDGNALLSRIVANEDDVEALLLITDPDAARAASEIGAGGTFSGGLGGGLTPRFFAPLTIEAAIERVIDDGRYRSQYPPSPVDAGLTAVLRVRNTTVVVTTNPVYQLDLECYRRLGLDPAAFTLVQVKSAGGFRAYYTPIAGEIVDLDTVGPCDSQLTRLPYTRIPRPLWPFDLDMASAW